MALGPLQLVVIGFDRPTPDGSILAELAAVRTQGFIRLVDALGVHKDGDGAIWSVAVCDLAESEAMLAGAAIGALIGRGAGAAIGALLGQGTGAEVVALEGARAGTERSTFGIAPEHILTIADQIPTGGAALLMLVEHTWLLPLRNAIRAQGGIIIANDFLSQESLLSIGAELAELDAATA